MSLPNFSDFLASYQLQLGIPHPPHFPDDLVAWLTKLDSFFAVFSRVGSIYFLLKNGCVFDGIQKSQCISICTNCKCFQFQMTDLIYCVYALRIICNMFFHICICDCYLHTDPDYFQIRCIHKQPYICKLVGGSNPIRNSCTQTRSHIISYCYLNYSFISIKYNTLREQVSEAN